MNIDEDYQIAELDKDVKGVYTFTETFKGKIVQVSFEIIAIARKLADKLNTFVATVNLGADQNQLEADAQQLIGFGADRVISVYDEQLTHYATLPYARAIETIIKSKKPEIFLFGATTTGRDLAPRVAARCNTGLSADCTAFDIADYYYKKENKIYKKVANFIRPSFAEAKLATILGNPRMWKYPQMGTARPSTFTPLPFNSNRTGSNEFFDVNFLKNDFIIKVLENIENIKDFVDFDRAQIIIAGGIGVQREDFNLLKEIVKAINNNNQKCELGATRRVIDSSWVDRAHQIGQTGRTVRPDFYIAVGISGAIQHIEGMKESKRIIAINNDPNAPIFQYADFGIVDDYKNILPRFLEKINAGFQFPAIN